MARIRANNASGGGGVGNVKCGFIPWSDLNGQTSITVSDLGFTPKRIVTFSVNAMYNALSLYDADRSTTTDYGAYYTSSFMNTGQAQSSASMYGAIYDVTNGGFKIKNINDSTVFTNGLFWFASAD